MPESLDTERKRMVEEQIQLRGISDSRVLQAFLKVPRHEFVPQRLRLEAYRDCPLPIGEGQTISQPYMVASMTRAADVQPGDRVLEIGTGSGYQAAILAELGAEVYTVERLSSLSTTAQEVLRELDYTSIHFKIANGTLGWESEAPFAAIVVTAGAPNIPPPLVDQLRLRGKLVVPIEEGLSQVLYVVVKTEGGIEKNRGERCTFVPLVGEYGWEE
jgi:protein-L-isoaspartate(D-aspartate) O-methyltransferase